MTFYAIRHKDTGKYMPLMKRGRGYTHWNPNNKEKEKIYAELPIPRLLISSKQARRCIDSWTELPNSYGGRYDGDIKLGKDDGRKNEDLEIVEVKLKAKGLTEPFWSNLNFK